MSDRAQLAMIRGRIMASWPQRFAPEQLGDGIPLGEGGLGLDSVELADGARNCARRWSWPRSIWGCCLRSVRSSSGSRRLRRP